MKKSKEYEEIENLKAGRRLGKYKLLKHLGTGGSCEVWEARDTVEGICVALKIPLVDIRGKRDAGNLLREIRLVTGMRHPHILSVKNADIIEGHPILATELSTKSLGDCSRPMSPRRVISIIMQVLEALAYAHRHRVVHCDVTPGNIFLFPGGRAALGDFGISLRMKRQMETIDEFGTPGYVAPEQAYGKPTYRSDCFAAGIILYEYITGVLPKWPFKWPFRGYKRLRQKTSLAFEQFLRTSLAIEPERRFANASEMYSAMIEAVPKRLKKTLNIKPQQKLKSNWLKMRRQAFVKRYQKVLRPLHKCCNCGEMIAESMLICPWCGSDKNNFERRGRFSYVCPRCHKTVSAKWRFCPWCYGAGFESTDLKNSISIRYHDRCKHCGGKIMRFMRYCPWCRRKIQRSWQVRPFPEICGRCGWSVDSSFWNYCPWCKQMLIE